MQVSGLEHTIVNCSLHLRSEHYPDDSVFRQAVYVRSQLGQTTFHKHTKTW